VKPAVHWRRGRRARDHRKKVHRRARRGGARDKLRQAGARVVELSLPELGTLVLATTFPIILRDLGPSLTAYLATFSGPSLERVVAPLSPDIKATFERAPIAGDDKAYAKAVNVARPQLHQ
jgi:hypothetical protein